MPWNVAKGQYIVYKKPACSSHMLLQHLVVINLLPARDSKFTVTQIYLYTLNNQLHRKILTINVGTGPKHLRNYTIPVLGLKE